MRAADTQPQGKRTSPVGRWWRYKVFWPMYRALMPRRTRRIFVGYWTYTKPGRQSGPWLDRVFITERWRTWTAYPKAGTKSEGHS